MDEFGCLVILLLRVLISRAAPHITSGRGTGGADSRTADHSLTSLRQTSVELQPAEVSIRPIRKLRAVPKACPNGVARAVFWWLVVARKGSSEGIPSTSPAWC